MKINYFGEIADITKQTTEHVELKDGLVSELLSYLLTKYKLDVEDMHIAVNHEIVSTYEDVSIREHDEVAVLSPFAGG